MTFDEWYAMQKHQLSNEQVCRVIWEAAAREERETMEPVLSALENIASTSSSTRIRRVANEALTAIRAKADELEQSK